MRLEFYKSYQQVHIWTGIISGLLLYICFIAGALTMFKAPLNQWALQQEARLPQIDMTQYDALLQKVLLAYPDAAKDLTVYLPSTQPQHAPVSWVVEDSISHAASLWHASLDSDGELITSQTQVSAIGDFLDTLHRTAGIPGGDDHDAYGIFVMGLVCILYVVAIVSGLIIFLPSWFKDLLAIRKEKNTRRFWVDFHNVLGITALPFHLIIALTTIVFAYHDLLYASMQQWVYKDTPIFSRPAPSQSVRNIASLASIQQLEQSVRAIEPEFQPAVLNFAALGTPAARVLIGGELAGQWVRGPKYAYVLSDPYNAEPGYTAMLPSVSGIMGKVVNGFFTLHFGGFGGGLVHWLYFGLGLSGALLFLTGNIIWIESRRKKQQQTEGQTQQNRSVKVMARLTVGVTLGTLIGVAMSLLCAKWLPREQLDISTWQQAGYYLGFLSCLLLAFFLKPIVAAKHLLAILCALLTLLVLSTLWWLDGSQTAGVDFTFCMVCSLLAVACMATWRHLCNRQAQIPQDNVWA